MADSTINSRKPIEDDAALQPSYGAHIPDPAGFTTGKMQSFSLVAGSGNNMSPTGIHLEDSIRSQYGNLPGSRGAK